MISVSGKLDNPFVWLFTFILCIAITLLWWWALGTALSIFGDYVVTFWQALACFFIAALLSYNSGGAKNG